MDEMDGKKAKFSGVIWEGNEYGGLGDFQENLALFLKMCIFAVETQTK